MSDPTPPYGYSLPPGYTFDGLARCVSCQAPIQFAITRKGNRAPMNPDGISHFATCPNAADHRRPRSIHDRAVDPPVPANRGSEYSADARLPENARRIKGRRLDVLRAIAAKPDYWSSSRYIDEADPTHAHQSVSPAFTSLAKEGLIVQTSERVNRRGRREAVYSLAGDVPADPALWEDPT